MNLPLKFYPVVLPNARILKKKTISELVKKGAGTLAMNFKLP